MSEEKEIKALLDTMRPYIQMDGGDITFHSFEDGIVTVLLHGACAGCDMIDTTLRGGIEALLMSSIPSVKGCVARDA